MDAKQRLVWDFHAKYDIARSAIPHVPDKDSRRLRLRLIEEELEELDDAFHEDDVVGIADALGDLLYVVYGTAVTCGIDLDPIFREIHQSNMTKTGRRADGKITKGEGFQYPVLAPLLTAQGWAG